MEAVPPLSVLSVEGEESYDFEQHIEHLESEGYHKNDKTKQTFEELDTGSLHFLLFIHSVDWLVEDKPRSLAHTRQNLQRRQ